MRQDQKDVLIYLIGKSNWEDLVEYAVHEDISFKSIGLFMRAEMTMDIPSCWIEVKGEAYEAQLLADRLHKLADGMNYAQEMSDVLFECVRDEELY